MLYQKDDLTNRQADGLKEGQTGIQTDRQTYRHFEFSIKDSALDIFVRNYTKVYTVGTTFK